MKTKRRYKWSHVLDALVRDPNNRKTKHVAKINDTKIKTDRQSPSINQVAKKEPLVA
jgi:uncharacterized protein YjcR